MSLPKGIDRARANRMARQEALREQLEKQGHLQHVQEIAQKLQDLKDDPLDSVEVQRLRAAAEIRLQLIRKYVPDLKAVEHAGSLTIAHESALQELLGEKGDK